MCIEIKILAVFSQGLNLLLSLLTCINWYFWVIIIEQINEGGEIGIMFGKLRNIFGTTS